MNDENTQNEEKVTRSQFKAQSQKKFLGLHKFNFFKNQLAAKLSDQPTVETRSERDTEEFKQKKLGKRLNIAIIVLILLLITVLAIMRYVG